MGFYAQSGDRIAVNDKIPVLSRSDKLGTVNGALHNLSEYVCSTVGILVSSGSVNKINVITVLHGAAAVAGHGIRGILNAVDIYFLVAVAGASEKRNKA